MEQHLISLKSSLSNFGSFFLLQMKGMPENNQKFQYLVDWTTKLTSLSGM